MRGATAKINVENKIREAFGGEFIGIVDKKIIVEADDGGEKVQIAITLTCPKNPVVVDQPHSESTFPSEQKQENLIKTGFKGAEVTEDEIENIKKMLKVLDF